MNKEKKDTSTMDLPLTMSEIAPDSYLILVVHDDDCLPSFSRSVAKQDVFTRQQLSEKFQEGYESLEVRCRTLENLANFKDLVAPVTNRIPNITKYHGFHIYREGLWMVLTVKLKMHDDVWLGFSEDGKEVGSGAGFRPWRLMRQSAVRLEEAPPYQLKTVPPEIIRQVKLRQEAMLKKLPSNFPGGECDAFAC